MSGVYQNIEKYRILSGLSKMEFYDLINYDSGKYVAMVRANSIKLSTLMLIAEKLKVSLADLLNDELKTSLSKLPQNDTSPAKPAHAYSINPLLLEPDMINAVTRLNLSDTEKTAIINDKVSLLQLHLKALVDKTEKLELEAEKYKAEINRLVH